MARMSRAEADAKRRRNRQQHWRDGGEKARAKGPAAYAAYWWDVARSIAVEADREGRPQVWNELSSALHDFMQRHNT
ncbi:hypothetical protein ACFWA9_04630 [Kitasatospora sp. NPDC059973]|uniref:hypothetical protein n=1 Tax=Kitasatospora sp. NPDC059973 TaxID=3347020 RepID=UPI0036C313C1